MQGISGNAGCLDSLIIMGCYLSRCAHCTSKVMNQCQSSNGFYYDFRRFACCQLKSPECWGLLGLGRRQTSDQIQSHTMGFGLPPACSMGTIYVVLLICKMKYGMFGLCNALESTMCWDNFLSRPGSFHQTSGLQCPYLVSFLSAKLYIAFFNKSGMGSLDLTCFSHSHTTAAGEYYFKTRGGQFDLIVGGRTPDTFCTVSPCRNNPRGELFT